MAPPIPANGYAAALDLVARLSYRRMRSDHRKAATQLAAWGMGTEAAAMLRNVKGTADEYDAIFLAHGCIALSHRPTQEGPDGLEALEDLVRRWGVATQYPMASASYLMYAHGALNLLTHPAAWLPHNRTAGAAERVQEEVLEGMVRNGVAPTETVYCLVAAAASTPQEVDAVLAEMAREGHVEAARGVAAYNARLFQHLTRGRGGRGGQGSALRDLLAEYRYNNVAANAATISILLHNALPDADRADIGVVTEVQELLAEVNLPALTPDGLLAFASLTYTLAHRELSGVGGGAGAVFGLLSSLEVQIAACERAEVSVPLDAYRMLLHIHRLRGDGVAHDALLARITTAPVLFDAAMVQGAPAVGHHTASFLSLPFHTIVPYAAA